MNRSQRLKEDKIWKLLLKFSLPAIVGMMVNALYNVIDRIFIGRGVGADGLAGITIGFPIMLIFMAFGMLVGVGGSALISIKLGEDNKDEAELILGNSVLMLTVIILIFSVLGLVFLEPLLISFGASDDVLPYAKQYLTIILGGAIFQGIGFGMNNYIRAEGNPKIAMITMLIGAIINIILDPLFIFRFNWGIQGAAWATIIAQAVSSVWVLLYFFGGKSTLKIRRENLRLNKNIVTKILAIGSAPFSMQIASSIVITLFNRQLATYGGDTAISVMGIIHSVSMFTLMPIFGINQGAQPIIGYNYGAKAFNRVKETLKMAIVFATVIVTSGFLITRLFPRQIIYLFNRENIELIEMGINAIQIFLFALPIIGFQIVSSNYFQAVGKAKIATLLTLSRQVLVLIPLLLILPKYFGLMGVWLAAPISDIASSVLSGTFLKLELKKLTKKTINE
ncbi:MATE family efflux transporter [Serpentinicella sp. ANB-PHB4]|uniref:MATE family efflux transporter n=1 Tax=Serpentinicella sp. ANB-PHB4 TaxID=3074076 RepID=UPI002865A76E|nr:MATE family efflux transporter [Serpentinicella sp. ANB-PHB4]MDR5659604.1 MATE family efflux transporter [Serpentinicella sp. ANB-PHB4]